MAPFEPTHGDIMVQIGELKGQVSTLITLVGQKRDDINAIYGRISLIEKTGATHIDLSEANARVDSCNARVGLIEREMGKWAGICIGIAVLMPVVLPQIQRALGAVPQPTIPHRTLP